MISGCSRPEGQITQDQMMVGLVVLNIGDSTPRLLHAHCRVAAHRSVVGSVRAPSFWRVWWTWTWTGRDTTSARAGNKHCAPDVRRAPRRKLLLCKAWRNGIPCAPAGACRRGHLCRALLGPRLDICILRAMRHPTKRARPRPVRAWASWRSPTRRDASSSRRRSSELLACLPCVSLPRLLLHTLPARGCAAMKDSIPFSTSPPAPSASGSCCHRRPALLLTTSTDRDPGTRPSVDLHLHLHHRRVPARLAAAIVRMSVWRRDDTDKNPRLGRGKSSRVCRRARHVALYLYTYLYPASRLGTDLDKGAYGS